MSYSSVENSAQDGKPVECYRFLIGSTLYLYTSAQEEIVSNTNGGLPETYLPIEIDRTAPEQSKELQRTALNVTVPRDAAIAALFVSSLPSKRIHLSIFRQHDGNPTEFIKFWQGRVKQVTWKESLAELECHPTMMGLKRQGLRKNFGGSCQHALYDDGCTVLKTDFDTAVTVSAVSGETITGSGEIAATSAADWFVSGYAQRANGETRFVIEQSGDTVRVLTPFTSLPVSEVITIYAGCKRDADTCAVKFNNIDNFFGFHVNPKSNPFKVGLK
jgi:uncharacterized phage protein (TIGR02218 family)